jgi:hypothetical protein
MRCFPSGDGSTYPDGLRRSWKLIDGARRQSTTRLLPGVGETGAARCSRPRSGSGFLLHDCGRGTAPSPALPHARTVMIGGQSNHKSFGMIDFDLLAVT